MKTEDFTDAVGKQGDSDAVKNLLDSLGMERRVTIKQGVTDVYLNNMEAGVSLLFESERYLSSEYKVNFPSDAPVLTAIFLYGSSNEEFSEYQGELPMGLMFSDSRDVTVQKLGPSAEFNPDMNSECWDMPGNIRFFVDYADAGESIEIAQFGISWR
jgi:hypothetical protein